MPEYRQGTGPNRLPQGGAQQVNEAQPPKRDMVGELALENQDVPVMFAPGEEDPIDEGPASSEDLEILLGDPDPGFTQPVVGRRRGRVPQYTVRHIAQFRAAAMQPDAPPTLRALYNATIRHLEAEQRNG